MRGLVDLRRRADAADRLRALRRAGSGTTLDDARHRAHRRAPPRARAPARGSRAPSPPALPRSRPRSPSIATIAVARAQPGALRRRRPATTCRAPAAAPAGRASARACAGSRPRPRRPATRERSSVRVDRAAAVGDLDARLLRGRAPAGAARQRTSCQVGDRLAVDRADRVAVREARLRRRGARRRARHDRLRVRHAVHEEAPVQHDREQEVGDRPGDDDREALATRAAG